jgi:hypothetical protein
MSIKISLEKKNLSWTFFFVFYLSFSLTAHSQTIFVTGGKSNCDLIYSVNGYPRDYCDLNHKAPVYFLGISYFERKFFSVNSSIGVIEKGGTYEFMNDSKILNYISVNTLGRIKLPVKFLKPFIEFGPRIDFLYNTENLDTFERNGAMNRVPFGAVVGGGMEFTVKRIYLSAGGYYSFNFTKLEENHPEQLYGTTIKDKTILLNVSIGYKLFKSKN